MINHLSNIDIICWLSLVVPITSGVIIQLIKNKKQKKKEEKISIIDDFNYSKFFRDWKRLNVIGWIVSVLSIIVAIGTIVWLAWLIFWGVIG